MTNQIISAVANDALGNIDIDGVVALVSSAEARNDAFCADSSSEEIAARWALDCVEEQDSYDERDIEATLDLLREHGADFCSTTALKIAVNTMHHFRRVYTVSVDGELQYESFASEQLASDFVSETYDDDLYLVKVAEMTEKEFHGRLTLSSLFDSETAKKIEDVIQKDDDPAELYRLIAAAEGQEWILDQYAKHVKFALLDGGYASDEEFHDVKLKSFPDFLSQLRKDIDFADDYDAALAKHN